MKIQRLLRESVVMTQEEIKSFIAKYISKKTGKKVKEISQKDDGDYIIDLEDEHTEEDLGE